MGLRFRKSFKLAPGLRLNMSKSGFGLSVGPRGASVSFGPRGIYQNVSLGAGFSFRQRVGGPSPSRLSSPRQESPKVNMGVTIGLQEDGTVVFKEEDGTVVFKDQEGNLLPQHLQALAKKQQGDTVKAWLSKNCDELNQKIESLESIHLSTPSPFQKPVYTPIPCESESPLPHEPKPVGILGYCFPWVRRRIEAENQSALDEYVVRFNSWKELKNKHEETEAERRILLEERLYREPEAMQLVLEQCLVAIQWPRETNISTDISPDGKTVALNVDLPEIEDVPKKTAAYGGRGWKISIKDLSEQKVAQLYMRHVHGIAFRLIGETFAVLPTVQVVVVSGYSQRPNKTTGQIQDEYLYSIKVARSKWEKLNFSNIGAIDVTDSLLQFEIRQDSSKRGVFVPIKPFSCLGQEVQ